MGRRGQRCGVRCVLTVTVTVDVWAGVGRATSGKAQVCCQPHEPEEVVEMHHPAIIPRKHLGVYKSSVRARVYCRFFCSQIDEEKGLSKLTN